ncbi:MAG: isopentenyl transferase family protein [Planctomycetota bacterium]
MVSSRRSIWRGPTLGERYAWARLPQSTVSCQLMHPILAITGATGTGKTSIALAVAERTGATVLPLDQLHRYRHLPEGTGLDVCALSRVRHYGYQMLSPWEVSGPARYVEWLRTAVLRVASFGPVIIEGGCTSYLAKLMGYRDDSVLGRIKIVALTVSQDANANSRRIKSRVSAAKVQAVLQETRQLEQQGYLSEAGIPFLLECESLWKHPEHDERTVAWAVRIAARIYCPAYLAVKGIITADSARDRMIVNVGAIQRYQASRIEMLLPDASRFSPHDQLHIVEQLAAGLIH